SVNVGAYVIEGANPRHEHEWVVWKDVKLPAGRVLIPGVISHATNVVEHPALVAERIVRLAKLLGRENVIAGTDCGFAQGPFHRRVHPSVMWAKLEALVEGARLASKELWTCGRDIIADSLHCCGLLRLLSSRGIHGESFMSNRMRALLAAVVVILTSPALPAKAQQYPSKPVRMIVPFG